MKKIEKEEVVTNKKFDYYEAEDGTRFYGYGHAESIEEREKNAKTEVERYEASALCVVGIKLKSVMENSCKHFSETIDRLLDFYEGDDYERWFFEPKTQEDVDNFLMWIKLKDADCYTCDYHNKMKPGEKYWCYVSPCNRSTYIYSMENIKKRYEDGMKFIEDSFKEPNESTDSSESN